MSAFKDGNSGGHDAARGSRDVPQHLVDAFFDRELDPPARMELFALLRKDPRAALNMERTQEAIDAIREPEATPDLTPAILREWESRRAAGLAPTPTERAAIPAPSAAWWAAGALAAALALAVGAVVLLQTGANPPSPSPIVEGPKHSPAPTIAAGPALPVPPVARERLVGELRPGALSVRALNGADERGMRLPSGAGIGSIFSWGELARADAFAARIARSSSLVDGWGVSAASREAVSRTLSMEESTLVPIARTTPVLSGSHTLSP